MFYNPDSGMFYNPNFISQVEQARVRFAHVLVSLLLNQF